MLSETSCVHGQTRSLHLRNTLAEHLVDKWHPKKIITHSRTLACRAQAVVDGATGTTGKRTQR